MSVFADAAPDATPVWFTPGGAPLPQAATRWAEATGFENGPGKTLLTPDGAGGLAGVVFGVESGEARQINPFLAGRLVGALPAGTYRFDGELRDARLAALASALGAYRFTRYGKPPVTDARLVAPDGVD
ncbi:leucyl aminopeptidase family protein, partial [Methylopila musalis]